MRWYQPKVHTLEFVLVQVVGCNWHLSSRFVTSKHSRQSILKNTPRLVLITSYISYHCHLATLIPCPITTRPILLFEPFQPQDIQYYNILSRLRVVLLSRWTYKLVSGSNWALQVGSSTRGADPLWSVFTSPFAHYGYLDPCLYRVRCHVIRTRLSTCRTRGSA